MPISKRPCRKSKPLFRHQVKKRSHEKRRPKTSNRRQAFSGRKSRAAFATAVLQSVGRQIHNPEQIKTWEQEAERYAANATARDVIRMAFEEDQKKYRIYLKHFLENAHLTQKIKKQLIENFRYRFNDAVTIDDLGRPDFLISHPVLKVLKTLNVNCIAKLKTYHIGQSNTHEFSIEGVDIRNFLQELNTYKEGIKDTSLKCKIKSCFPDDETIKKPDKGVS